MAVTSTIEYCTNRDLQDIFPHLPELKRRLYNFTLLGECAKDNAAGQSVYIVENTGLISNLFIDGQDMQSRLQTLTAIGSGDDAATDTAESISPGEISITTESGGNALVDPGWVIGLGLFGEAESSVTELMLITDTATSDTISVRRAFNGTTEPSSYATNANIFYYLTMSQKGQWYYNENDDLLLLTWDSNPNNSIIEAGDDWATIRQRFRRKASRLIESHLDNRLSREVLKDREGNYPAIIVHATALQAVLLLLKAHDPNNELIAPFQGELNEILEGLKAGTIVLPTGISSDSSKGVIREVSVNSSSDLRPVELKGNYNQYGYDNIKVVVDSGGIIGTSTYSVYVKDSDKLKTDQVVTSEKITGDYDMIVSGLYMRWSGDDVITAVTTTNDEYEIEVHSSSINTSVSSIGSIRMTRR